MSTLTASRRLSSLLKLVEATWHTRVQEELTITPGSPSSRDRH